MNRIDSKWRTWRASLASVASAAASAPGRSAPGVKRLHPAAAAPGVRVLLVEDDEAIRSLVVEFLTDEGYDVLATPDGATALTLVGPPGHWRPDLLLLDMYLPGMDGSAFARQYRQLPLPHAPIVLLTGASGATAAGQTEALGATGFLPKPFDLDALVAMVRRCTAERHCAVAP